MGPTPYPVNSPETQIQFSPRINTISNVGPSGLVGWGSIGAHSIPSKQPRNPGQVYPTNPHNIRRGAQQGLLAEAQLGPTPYPANSPETQAQFSPHIHAISDVGPNWVCHLGPNWCPIHTQQTAQKPKPSVAHTSTQYPTWGPTVLASWGPIGAHSIPSKQPRNPSPV